MDPARTTPFPFRTRIEIINSQTGEKQCLFVPNPYGNVSAQVWANPETKKATLKVNGTTITEDMQGRISEILGRPEAYLLTDIHEKTEGLGQVTDGIEHGHKQFDKHYKVNVKSDSLTLHQHTAKGKFKQVTKVSDNYRANGPAIARPNPASPHPPGTKGYRATTQAITPMASKAIRQGGRELNALGGTLMKRAGSTIGFVGDVADATEFGQYVNNKQYDKATAKASGFVGGKAGARAGAMAGARLGMLLPIPIPLFKAGAVVILSVGGGIAGGIYGEKAMKTSAEWLYNKAVEKTHQALWGSNDAASASKATPPKPDDVVGTIGIRFNNGQYSEGPVHRSDYQGDDYRPLP